MHRASICLGYRVMAVTRFTSVGGPVEHQAEQCFEGIRGLLEELGHGLSRVRVLTVEVARPASFDVVTSARRRMFGEQKPRVISRRFARLPPGQHVRLTVCIEESVARDGNAPTT